MRDIGKNIRQLRIRRNMTQDDLAQALYVTRQTVSNYETGRSKPDIEMLERIADALGTDLQEILYGTAPKQSVRISVILCVIAAVLGVLLAVLYPTAQEIARNTYRMELRNVLFVLTPLYVLFLGWLVAYLLGTALRKKPLKGTVARWAGRILAGGLGLWFVLMAVSYWGFPIGWVTRLNYAVYVFSYKLSVPDNWIWLVPGVMLWLLGFPEKIES